MSDNTPVSLREILYQSVWQESEDGVLHGTYYRRGITTAFTEQDLANLHPDLPSATREQLRWLTGGLLGGANLEWQLHYLTEAPLLLPESSPGEQHCVATLQDLRRLATPDQMMLSVQAYRVRTTENVPFVLPNKLGACGYALPTSWFDAHFPGWLPRFEAAEFLGLSGEDLIAHVLTTKSRPGPDSIDMPDITFD